MSEEFVYPLTAEQNYFYEYQKFAPDSTMYNHYPMLIKLRDFVDTERLIQAIRTTLHAHPAYLTVIDMLNGQPIQKYIPDLITDIPIERISEAEFMTLKDDLIQPFSIDGEALCRFRIFITEKHKYLFWDDHHIVCDGIGKVNFFHDLQKVYDGQKIARDSWFAYLQEREEEKYLPHYNESRKWYEDFYGHHDFCGYPATDFAVLGEGYNKQGLLLIPSGIIDNDLEILRRFHLTRTEFFTTVSLIATSEYNHDPRVLITWCYKGRWKKEHHSITGMMLQDMPVYVNMQSLSFSEIFAAVREQAKVCLRHKDYPYTSLDGKMLEDDKLCVIYQGRIYEAWQKIICEEKLVDMDNKKAGSQNILDIEIMEADHRIDLLFDYAAHRYRPESIQRFADMFVRTTHDLLSAMNGGRL